jgi:hypothetical protein
VADLKTGPALALDHMLLYQLFQDPAFYAAVPAFFFLKGQGLAVTAKITASIVAGDDGCGGCGGGIKAAMEPVIVQFVEQLRKLKDDAPHALEPLVAYVAKRRGFRPVPLVVYYRGSDGGRAAVEM